MNLNYLQRLGKPWVMWLDRASGFCRYSKLCRWIRWAERGCSSQRWLCIDLQLRYPRQRILAILAAHFRIGFEPGATLRSLRLIEDRAAQVVGELYAMHACRFAVGHAWNGRLDGRRDAAGAAMRATVHADQYAAVWFSLPVICTGRVVPAPSASIARVSYPRAVVECRTA